MRASDLVGHIAYDDTGRRLGRIIDVIAVRDQSGQYIVDGVKISRRRYRLLSYDRKELTGPALLRRFARLLQGPLIVLPYDQLRLSPDQDGPQSR
jgi:hypothetical protein